MKVALKSKAAILYETLSNDIYDSDNSMDSEVYMKCPNCDRNFKNVSALKAHVQTIHADVEEAIMLAEMRETGKVSCPQCNRFFKTPHYLSQHIQFKHNPSEKPKPSVEGKRSRQVYLTQSEYNDMLAADGEDKWILCPHCLHVPFRAQQNLFQHLTIIHPELALDPRVIEKLKGKESDEVVVSTSSVSNSSTVGRKKKNGGLTSGSLEPYGQDAKYDREAKRKSYTNDFKASILDELQSGVSRKSISLLHDIPMRTLDKWATTERDKILVASRFNHIAGHKRIRTDDLNSIMHSDGKEND